MRYKIFLIILLMVFPSSLIGIPKENDSVEKEVLRAARKELPGLLQEILPDEIILFGFNTQDEIFSAKLGTPLKIYTIHPEELENFYGLKSISEILKDTGHWYVPVVVNDEYRALLTVCLVKEKWEAVGIGGARLASEIGDFYTRVPDQMKIAGIYGDTDIRFVRVFQAFSDFMYMQNSQVEYLTLLKSAQIALEMPEEGLLNPQIIMPRLLIEVKRNLHY